MKLTHYIYILGASFALLTASCDDDITPRFTVGEENNAIVLGAGIMDGGSGAGVQTRAAGDPHVAFSSTTQTRLYVEGKWHSNDVTKYTNCSTGAADFIYDGSANDTHPLGSFNPQLYWDDFGTADPDNTASRANGLAVYGVAVEGLSTLPSELNNITNGSWTNLSWAVNTDGSNVLSKDIIVSNNHGDNSASDKTGIKFDQRTDDKNNANYKNNILIYQHMMSKVTFVLTAGEGFTDGKFTNMPEVVLTRNKTGESNTEWCNTNGTINIKTATANGSSVGMVKLQHLNTTDVGVVTEHALIYPGSNFGGNDNDIIARIKADDNIYYVTAKQIRAALEADDNHSDKNTKSGYNYIIKVTVDKTEIKVTATIKDWMDVEADTETPKINVVANVGDATVDANTKDGMPSFDFYLSDAAGANASTAYDKKATATKPTEGADGATVWTFKDESDNAISLYWPNHQTHYLMRGVSPKNTTVSSGKIVVSNMDYSAEATSMSNLLVGAPVIADNTMCGNPDHPQVDMSTGGICAREGKINLTFNYMMSQLEVHLTTAATTAPEYVNLTNAKVELVNVYNAGQVDIHSKTVTTTGSTGDFEVKHVGSEDANYRHSAVVPQNLTFSTPGATSNLRFKITCYKNGDTEQGIDDIYYADIKPIKVKEPGDSESKAIEKWDAGKHYIYTLDLKKTEIKVTATIADWIPVTASEDVWF